MVFPAAAGAWVEVDEERLLVCRVGELLGVLDRVEDCPLCGGRGLENEVLSRCAGASRRSRRPKAEPAQAALRSESSRGVIASTRLSSSATSGSSPSARARRHAAMHSCSRSVRASAWA